MQGPPRGTSAERTTGRWAMPIIIFGKWPFVLIVLAIFLWWRYTEAKKKNGAGGE